MASAPKVGIIVLNYNGARCLSRCLQSLHQLVYENKEIIVVDNDSTDTSFGEARRAFPLCTFVQNTKNEGFAKGMNSGMRLAFQHGAEYCLLFNFDAVIAPDALSTLVATGEKYPRVGLLSPVIYTPHNTLWFAKGKIDFFHMRAIHINPSAQEFAADAYPSDFLTGCALFIKKELVESIGYLDERFFLYYEDADYSLRARNAGFLCLVVPRASVWHSEESKKNGEKVYYLVYSGLLFFSLHFPLLFRPYLAMYVTIRRIKNAFDRVLGDSSVTREVYRAYEKFYHGDTSSNNSHRS